MKPSGQWNASLDIRKAQPEDAAAISNLIVPLAEKFIACDFSPHGVRALLDSMTCESVAGYLQQGYRYHVAEVAGGMIGVVAIRDNFHLYHLFVHEAYHRQGIARRLWEVAKQESFAAGNPGRFTVNSSRFAVGVYRRLGFVPAGPAKDCNGVVCFPMEYDMTMHTV